MEGKGEEGEGRGTIQSFCPRAQLVVGPPLQQSHDLHCSSFFSSRCMVNAATTSSVVFSHFFLTASPSN
jgi:hypothetical protein